MSVCWSPVMRRSFDGIARAARLFSVSHQTSTSDRSFKLVIVGGGTGGCTVAAKFARLLPRGSVAVVEPSQTHYYQPLWTLVGGGMKTVGQSARPMSETLPKHVAWIQSGVASFDPKSNSVTTTTGDVLSYEYLVVAMGLQLNYQQIKGLPEGFSYDGVCSNYSPLYVEKTFEAMRQFKKGNAVFTMPNTPIKCAGAPLKAMFIAEDYFRRNGRRSDANVIYNSSLGFLFGAPKYAEALWKVVKQRDITVNLRHELIEVKGETQEAVFRLLDKPGETLTIPYEMLHVTPPMSTPEPLRSCKDLVNDSGFLNVSKFSLQHMKYQNIFGIGDCTSLPTSRTAAAIAAQAPVLFANLKCVMESEGQVPDQSAIYDGYTSCPLVTGYSKCILAEFDYNGKPLETLPLDQGKERRLAFHIKKDLIPFIYWNLMLKGHWNGSATLRKIFHLGKSR